MCKRSGGGEDAAEENTRKRGMLTNKDMTRRGGGEGDAEESKRHRGEDTMEDLGMLGILGDVKNAAKGFKEERKVVQTTRAMGKRVSITSQRAGTEVIRHQNTHGA